MQLKNAAAKLWTRIDIAEYKGTFVTLGDVDNDGEVEFLLSYLGPYSAHLRLVAVDLNGAKTLGFRGSVGRPPRFGHAVGHGVPLPRILRGL